MSEKCPAVSTPRTPHSKALKRSGPDINAPSSTTANEQHGISSSSETLPLPSENEDTPASNENEAESTPAIATSQEDSASIDQAGGDKTASSQSVSPSTLNDEDQDEGCTPDRIFEEAMG